MTWEWLVIAGGIYFVIQAIGEVERHARQSAESLVKIESAVKDMGQPGSRD